MKIPKFKVNKERSLEMLVMDVNTSSTDTSINRPIVSNETNCLVNISSKCKNMPRRGFKYMNSEVGIYVTLNDEYNRKFSSTFIDIKFKAAKFKYPSPSDKTLLSFIELNNLLEKHNVKIKSLSPAEDGGVAVDFVKGTNYFSLELLNNSNTSIYIVDNDSGRPLLLDDIKSKITNKTVSAYL